MSLQPSQIKHHVGCAGNWIGAERDGSGGWITRRVGGWRGGPIWSGVGFGEFLETPFTLTASASDTLDLPPAATETEDDVLLAAIDSLFADDDFVAGV